MLAELGIPVGLALAFGDFDELGHDLAGIIGLVDFDRNFGPDSEDAKTQIKEGEIGSVV